MKVFTHNKNYTKYIYLARQSFLDKLREESGDIEYIFITDNLDISKQPRRHKLLSICSEDTINDFEPYSIACLTMNEIDEYINLPHHVLDTSYRFEGYAGMRKYDLHCLLRGWKYGNITDGYIDYIRIEVGKNKKIFDVDCKLKNNVHKESIELITNKSILFKTLRGYSFIPETRNLNQVKLVKDNEVLIAKPAGIGACAGVGIKIITNTNDLERLKEEIRYSKENKTWRWIVSKYITNPLLFKDLKFHLRGYLMVTTWNKIYIFDEFEIITAGNKYKNSNYNNKKIHDTHSKTTKDIYVYPYDLHDKRIDEGIKQIYKALVNKLKNKVYPYDESEYGYEILGLDIMFDDEYNPWLIEVNSQIAHETGDFLFKDKYINLTKKYLEWEYTNTLDYLFEKDDNNYQYVFTPLNKLDDDYLDQLSLISDLDVNSIITIMNEDKDDMLENRRIFVWTVYDTNTEKVIGYVMSKDLEKYQIHIDTTYSDEFLLAPLINEIRRYTGRKIENYKLDNSSILKVFYE